MLKVYDTGFGPEYGKSWSRTEKIGLILEISKNSLTFMP